MSSFNLALPCGLFVNVEVYRSFFCRHTHTYITSSSPVHIICQYAIWLSAFCSSVPAAQFYQGKCFLLAILFQASNLHLRATLSRLKQSSRAERNNRSTNQLLLLFLRLFRLSPPPDVFLAVTLKHTQALWHRKIKTKPAFPRKVFETHTRTQSQAWLLLQLPSVTKCLLQSNPADPLIAHPQKKLVEGGEGRKNRFHKSIRLANSEHQLTNGGPCFRVRGIPLVYHHST